MKKTITGDETWNGFNSAVFTMCWKNSPRSKKTWQVRSNVEIMLTVFSDIDGVMHHEFLPQRQTVNHLYYLEQPKQLRENFRRKRPMLWRNDS